MPLDASPDAAPPLSAGAFNLTAKNISKALKSAPLWLGFSAAHCTYCAVHEAQYSLYASTHAPHLPRLARVDAASERFDALQRCQRVYVDCLPRKVTYGPVTVDGKRVERGWKSMRVMNALAVEYIDDDVRVMQGTTAYFVFRKIS